MGIDEVRRPLREWQRDGHRAGVATLIDVRRSAPRRPGARFAVSEEGQLAGSVSSGCVEGDLHEHIQAVLSGEDSRLLHYGITDEMAAEVGLPCGGEIDVLVAEHDATDPVWERLDRVVDGSGAALLLLGLSDAIRGRTLLVEPDGRRTGSLGGADVDDAAVAAGRSLLERGGTAVLELPGSDLSVFAEAYLPPDRLFIVGASPVAEALSALAARLGFAVSVIDPREAFASEHRFPDAARVVRQWPDEALEELGLDPYAYVVVLAHDRKLDVPALAAALEAGCRYVGQIGGGRTQRIRREALAEEGISEEAIARIRGPVGLDIGAETPEEIAVAILAEMIAERRT